MILKNLLLSDDKTNFLLGYSFLDKDEIVFPQEQQYLKDYSYTNGLVLITTDIYKENIIHVYRSTDNRNRFENYTEKLFFLSKDEMENFNGTCLIAF